MDAEISTGKGGVVIVDYRNPDKNSEDFNKDVSHEFTKDGHLILYATSAASMNVVNPDLWQESHMKHLKPEFIETVPAYTVKWFFFWKRIIPERFVVKKGWVELKEGKPRKLTVVLFSIKELQSEINGPINS